MMTHNAHRACSWPYPILPDGWTIYNDDKDYCGPENEWYSEFLSRYIFGVDLNKVYWAHDNRYRLGTDSDDRRFADEQMKRDQKIAICRALAWYNPLRYLALACALRRYHAVRVFGQKAFEGDDE